MIFLIYQLINFFNHQLLIIKIIFNLMLLFNFIIHSFFNYN